MNKNDKLDVMLMMSSYVLAEQNNPEFRNS